MFYLCPVAANTREGHSNVPAVERILLYARSQGIWASFLNQPIEVPQIRLMLHNLIERVGFPQLLLRMGYGSEVPPTPRRSVNEVLLE